MKNLMKTLLLLLMGYMAYGQDTIIIQDIVFIYELRPTVPISQAYDLGPSTDSLTIGMTYAWYGHYQQAYPYLINLDFANLEILHGKSSVQAVYSILIDYYLMSGNYPEVLTFYYKYNALNPP